MNRISAIMAIQDYILDIKEPKWNWRMSRFEQCSYSRWAANEVLKYVRSHRDISPIMAIEEFIAKMDYFSCLNPNSSYSFSVAHDIAEDILDIFIAAQ